MEGFGEFTTFGTVVTSMVDAAPGGVKHPRQESDSHDSKRARVEIADPRKPSLERRGDAFYIPECLREGQGVLPPLSAEVRKTINDYQVEHLETRASSIHNQGVHLKQTAATLPVDECQVVAVYEGYLLQCRFLTPEEKQGAGLETSDAEPVETEDGVTEVHPKEQMIWYHHNGETRLINRPPSFHAYSSHIRYPDEAGRSVWLGIDALDSPYPISNINSSHERSNIIMVPCISEHLIKCISPEGAIELHGRPLPGDYHLLAVADRPILPGMELLLNYQAAVKYPGKMMHFWGPDEYFFPMLSPVPVNVQFSGDHSTASVVPTALQPNPELAALAKDIERYFDSKFSLVQMVYQLNLSHKNPLTGGYLWTPGCVQYLLELWNIERIRKYWNLTRLVHCFGPDGKLDHEGVNYLRGFHSTRTPSVNPPVNDPTSIEDVIEWLDASICQLERQHCNEIQQKELGYLRDEFQLLKTWRCRNTTEGPKKEVFRSLAETDVKNFINTAIIRREMDRTEGPHYFPFEELAAKHLQPHELWPQRMKPSIWRKAHIRCMSLSIIGVPEFSHCDPMDKLACYYPHRPEYAEAMKEAIKRKMDEGISLEALKARMSPSGLRPINKEGTPWDRNTREYVIPYIDGIPNDLHGTNRWSELTEAHWGLLGFSASSDEQLKVALERLYQRGGYNTVRRTLCDSCADTWNTHPDIKQAIRDDPPTIKPLLHHLIKLSGTQIPELTCEWRPLDSLMICKADTTIYDESMDAFLEQQLQEGKNAHDIARIFNKPDPRSSASNAVKQATKVQKPAYVTTSGDWTGEDVVTVIKTRKIKEPGHELLPEETFDVAHLLGKALSEETKPLSRKARRGAKKPLTIDTAVLRVRRALQELPEQAFRDFAEEHQLNIESLKSTKRAVVRYLLSILKVTLPDNPQLQEDLVIRDEDKLAAISRQHPDWQTEVTALISKLREKAFDDATIAAFLQSGNSNPEKCKALFPPLPLPPGYAGDCWSAETVAQLWSAQQSANSGNERQPLATQ